MEKLHISYPFLIFTSLLLALDRDGLLLLAWVAVIAHEAGHLLCIWLMGCVVDKISIRLSGLTINYSAGGQTSYSQDAAIALAGPLANILSIILLTIASRFAANEWLYYLIGANIIIAIFNLLPAMPADGGRIVLALASMKLGVERGVALAQFFTAVTGTVMAAAGVWILLETHGNFMLLASALIILCGLFGKRLYRTG